LHIDIDVKVERKVSNKGRQDDMPFKPIALSERSISVTFFKKFDAQVEKVERTIKPSAYMRPAITSARSREVTFVHLERREVHIVEQPEEV